MRVLLLITLAACSSKSTDKPPTPAPPPSTPSPPTPSPPTPTPSASAPTPNTFFSKGAPTLIIGTGGSDAEDRDIASQARLIQALALPAAKIVADTTITDPAKLPANPVFYGGPHVNSALARVDLPFTMTADELILGGQTFAGEGVMLITALPATSTHPELFIYAGTGVLGVAEINGRQDHGIHPLLIADAFGTVTTGRWTTAADGSLQPELAPLARRIEWRSVDKTAGAGRASFRFPAMLPAAPEDDQVIAAGMRGLDRALAKLGIADPSPLTLYVYPDRRSKQSLTGDAGDGHAVPSSLALHVLRADTRLGGGMEGLIAHEATHVYTRAAWGAAGSMLFGEGIAVWTAGRYADKTLEQWKASITRVPMTDLLGRDVRKHPEQQTYPIAGLFVEAAVRTVGLDKVRDHLFTATAAGWAEACKRAGTTPEALEQALTKLIGG